MERMHALFMESLSLQTEPFVFDGESFSAANVLAILREYVSEERRETIRSVVDRRTYTVAPVLEGVCDRGNISAVMRSAEALGYQSLHLIENQEKYKRANRVTQGADKWLDIVRWETTRDCLDNLKAKGYRIVATHVAEGSKPIAEVSFNAPTAIFFGNEQDGASDELIAEADDCVMIPMEGFSQSFNISVAAALTLYHIHHERTRTLGRHGDLTELEKDCLAASYYMRTVKSAEEILVRVRTDANKKEAG
jgi:tRNA (guanosine-2'-O-)-methyltransferase